MKSDPRKLPEVNFSDHGDVRYLHLGTEWIQGSMRLDAPFELELEYVQRMMAWLLFVDPQAVAKRHAMQLGLGGRRSPSSAGASCACARRRSS